MVQLQGNGIGKDPLLARWLVVSFMATTMRMMILLAMVMVFGCKSTVLHEWRSVK